jgi:hypothetical protein
MEWPVRFHRQTGYLRLSDGVLQFLPQERESTVRVIPLRRVKQILVSAPSSRVHLLKLQLEDNTPAVFEFRVGIGHRDEAREAIARALRSRSTTETSSEERDPLYVQLVESGLVPDSVYRKYVPCRNAASPQAKLFEGGSVLAAPAQRVGLPSALLTELRPAEESGRRIKYRFDPATIHQIFVEEPTVQRAYKDTVERGLMDEKSFWKKYVEMRTASTASVNGTKPNDAHAAARAFFAKYEQSTGASDTALKDHDVELATTQTSLPVDVDLRRNEYERKEHREEHLADALALLHRFNRHGQLVMDASHFRPDEKEWLKRSALVLEELVEEHRTGDPKEGFDSDGFTAGIHVSTSDLLPLPMNVETVDRETYEATLGTLTSLESLQASAH